MFEKPNQYSLRMHKAYLLCIGSSQQIKWVVNNAKKLLFRVRYITVYPANYDYFFSSEPVCCFNVTLDYRIYICILRINYNLYCYQNTLNSIEFVVLQLCCVTELDFTSVLCCVLSPTFDQPLTFQVSA
jgi:hypothetical protein